MTFEVRSLRVDLISKRMTITIADTEDEHSHIIANLVIANPEDRSEEALKDAARAAARKAHEDAIAVL